MAPSCDPQRQTLARGSMCSVDRCSCGILHVNIGPFSMRLEAAVVESLWRTLGEALHSVGRPASLPSSTSRAEDGTPWVRPRRDTLPS